MCFPYALASNAGQIVSFRIKNERRVTPCATQLIAHLMK
jgi:hypothetical protein